MRNQKKKRLCVFCGSSTGNSATYLDNARTLGELFAKLGIELVYGGGRVGLMGEIADAVLRNGGTAIGIIPQDLVDREIAHPELTELIVVGTMHERKALMEAISHGFIALPGGFGTLDEFFEILTWSQIGIHEKPCAILNVAGYFDNVITFMDAAVDQGFVLPQHREMILISDDAETLVLKMLSYRHSAFSKWTPLARK